MYSNKNSDFVYVNCQFYGFYIHKNELKKYNLDADTLKENTKEKTKEKTNKRKINNEQYKMSKLTDEILNQINERIKYINEFNEINSYSNFLNMSKRLITVWKC